jgi:hypothetical protein
MVVSISDSPEPEQTEEQLIELLEDQRDLLFAVATGTSITPELGREYARRRRAISANPLRWPDLRQFWAGGVNGANDDDVSGET